MKKDPSRHKLEVAAAMFRALADLPRLQTLVHLSARERSVTDLAELKGEKIATVSARLKVLLTARLVKRRREGQSIYYALSDTHVLNLIRNAVDHASH
jgi:DNA-binding transcriptional ArsR family regulator